MAIQLTTPQTIPAKVATTFYFPELNISYDNKMVRVLVQKGNGAGDAFEAVPELRNNMIVRDQRFMALMGALMSCVDVNGVNAFDKMIATLTTFAQEDGLV